MGMTCGCMNGYWVSMCRCVGVNVSECVSMCMSVYVCVSESLSIKHNVGVWEFIKCDGMEFVWICLHKYVCV